MPHNLAELPKTLGELRGSTFSEDRPARRSVKDELRANLICKLQRREELFPGIVGYEDTVVPQVINAILSRHNFILLGLRGQAKTRHAVRRRLRNSRRSVFTDLPTMPAAD
jgi:magnesium chelatase subunit I